MKRLFSVLSIMLLSSSLFAQTITVEEKQLVVTDNDNKTVSYNLNNLGRAVFGSADDEAKTRYLKFIRTWGANIILPLDKVKDISYKKTTKQIAMPSTAPKVGDYYYSDGTWSDGGLISINDDGTNPVWKEVKPAPYGGKEVIGIVAMTDPSRMAEADKAAGFTHGYVISTRFIHDPNNSSVHTGFPFTTVKFSYEAEIPLYLPGAKTAKTWYETNDGLANCLGLLDLCGAERLKQLVPAVYYSLVQPHPQTSSMWFVPSTGQLWDILANLCGDEAAKKLKEWRTVESDATYTCLANLQSDPFEIFNSTLVKVADKDKELLMRDDYDYAQEYPKYQPSDNSAFCKLWTSCFYEEEAVDVFYIGTQRANGTSMFECEPAWNDEDAYCRPILAF
ncbi:MAG: hypothetical protein IJV13_06910 [Prevotella sp.]|nr:hypothetical protein [Prevotella sp.]